MRALILFGLTLVLFGCSERSVQVEVTDDEVALSILGGEPMTPVTIPIENVVIIGLEHLPTPTPTSMEETTSATESWTFRATKPDAVTGEIQTYISLETKIDDERQALLLVRCIDRRDEDLLQFVVFTTVESSIKQRDSAIWHRFDQDEPTSINWFYAHYGDDEEFTTGLFYRPMFEHSNDDNRVMIERLKKAGQFAIRFSSSQNNTETFLWGDVSGFEEAYRPVAQACNEVAVVETPTPVPTPTIEASDMDVSISDGGYMPRRLTVSPGTTVTWTNSTGRPHTVTHIFSPRLFDSKTIAPGESFQFQFNNVGIYMYTCLLHPTLQGTVEVN